MVDPEILRKNRRAATKFSIIAISLLIFLIFLVVRCFPGSHEQTWVVIAVFGGYPLCVLIGGLIWRARRNR